MKDKYKFKDKIDPTISGISQKTIHKIIQAWYDSGNAPPTIKPDIPEKDQQLLISQIKSCITNTGGEISHQAKLIHLAMIYINSSEQGKKVFLKILAYEFDVDLDFLSKKIEKLSIIDKETPERIQAEIELTNNLIPPRVTFLEQLSTLPNGFIFLKDMREFLLLHIKEIPRLQKLDNDIHSILKSYFDINLLKLREISWESPASTLEHLINYEAVHEIKSWKHLKHRLFSDHIMFGFFHPTMPYDPLIFVEVALVKGLADNIQKLIELDSEHGNPDDADTAIFYSISSTQKGLRGISFGNFLIKRVVKRISSDYPGIKNYATLSPIPLFSKWLIKHLEEGGKPLCKKSEIEKIIKISDNSDVNKSILMMLKTENWHQNNEITSALRIPLLRLALHYLTTVKRHGKFNAYDPVANFHLSNGAEIGQLNWLGDISENGLNQSFGIMANYRYARNRIVENHESYMTKGEVNVTKNIFKNQIFGGVKNIIIKKESK
ncbi:MAG: malonyl-CoA decarboxylase family protein [Bacteroidales bacterium]|nr:malonyl-CoA decarboxylase family protein [Bacteroidales bacterium]